MVNTSSVRIPPDMLYAPVDIPDAIGLETLDVATLPQDWFESPAPPACQHAGNALVTRGQTVGLIVPSAVARVDNNVLLNPAHPDFSRLVIGNIEVISVDRRRSNIE